MKRRSTTPVSSSFAAKAVIVAATIMMVVAGPIQMTQKVYADKYDEQISALQSQIDQYQVQAKALGAQADTYNAAISKFQTEIATLQTQIDLSQAKYDKLQADIAQTEKDIKTNQDALGTTLANMYVDDKISPLEMLASSQNIGDYLDKQEQRSAIRNNLTDTIGKIKDLKKSLQDQQTEVKRVLGDQQNQKTDLASKQAAQQQLYDQTKGEEAAYQKLSSDKNAQITKLREQQQAEIAARYSRGGSVQVLPGSSGGYPWNNSNCYVDANAYSHGGANGQGGDGWGYGCRQCASYAAWRVGQETGYLPLSWGNANQFPASAARAGYSYGSTPRAGSLGVISSGAFGHVVWIESYDPASYTVVVSQYNYLNAGGPGWGNYSKMQVSASTYDTYIYIK